MKQNEFIAGSSYQPSGGLQASLWLSDEPKDTDTNSENSDNSSDDGSEPKSDGGLADRTAARLKKLKSKISRHKKEDPNIYPLF